MPQSKANRDKGRLESGAVRGPAAQSGRRVNRASASRCEAALAKVLQLADRLARDTRETRGNLPSGRARPDDVRPGGAGGDADDAAPASARDQLAAAFRGLEPEMALKLRTLMVAGRDGQSIGAVNVNLSLSDADAGFAFMADDSSDNGPLLSEYLRRGHAIACATGINLDGPLADWQSASSSDLGERAWLSFGKQLANSSPADWQCIGIVEQRAQGFSKLYLRLGQHAWWSFRAVLDRPTAAGVERERRALAKRRFKGVSTHSLDALVAQFAGAQGRALQRAGRAICARVGHLASTAEP